MVVVSHLAAELQVKDLRMRWMSGEDYRATLHQAAFWTLKLQEELGKEQRLEQSRSQEV